jgi:hypothetical protein
MKDCACAAEGEPCQQCRADAVRVAEAAAETIATAINEVEHEDPTRGRVFTLRRHSDGNWRVVDVRPMGSAERARSRPQPARA